MFNIFAKKNSYVQNIESILEEKNVQEDIKKIIIKTFEKVTKNYPMYQEVKVDVKDEKEYKEELLEIIKSITSFEGVNVLTTEDKIVNKENSSVLIFEKNELSFFENLISKKQRNFLVNSKHSYSNIIARILKEASIYAEIEILTNFEKYKWEKSSNIICNYKQIVYQNLLWIYGYEFLNNWMNEEKLENKDYYQEMINISIKRFGEENTKRLFKNLEKMLYAFATEEEKESLKFIVQNEQKSLDLMEDTKNFLNFIGEEKVKLNEKISKLEKVINDEELLTAAFTIKKDKMLQENVPNTHLYTLNQYKELLETEYNDAKNKMIEYTNIQNPENYIKFKEELKDRIDFFANPNKDNSIVILQECIFDNMYEYLNNMEDEKVIVDSIYHLRYLRYCKYDEQKEAYLNPSLYQKMDKILKRLVYNGINNKVFNKVSQDFYTNYPIISPALKTEIPELTEIEISVIPRKNLLLQIFIHGALFKEIELIEVDTKLVNIKPQKKYKLFTSNNI